MLLWVIENILKPYCGSGATQCTPGLASQCLFVPQYRVSCEEDSRNDMGVQIEHIPGGCTLYCQAVDAELSKPLNGYMNEHSDQWLLENGSTKATTKQAPAAMQESCCVADGQLADRQCHLC